jgi:hypothetical protein
MIPLPPNVISFALSWWKAGAGALVGAALAFPLGQCSGVDIQKDRDKAASIASLQLDARAKETAAEQRGQDAATTAARAQGRIDATKNQPDAAPGALRCQFERKRLLDAGVKNVPACP